MKKEVLKCGDSIFHIEVPADYLKECFRRLRNRLGDEKYKELVKLALRSKTDETF